MATTDRPMDITVRFNLDGTSDVKIHNFRGVPLGRVHRNMLRAVREYKRRQMEERKKNYLAKAEKEAENG